MMQSAVMIVEDDAALRAALSSTLEVAGFDVLACENGEAALRNLAANDVGLVISDVQMPGCDGFELLQALRATRPDLPVVMMTAYGTVDRAVAAIRQGARDYLVKPFEADALVGLAERHCRSRATPTGLIAEDPLTLRLKALAGRVAASDATVLISGASGSGKEVFARYIHANSSRRDGPFVAINCAAIPDNMLEAVLFGHEKGAFTGAHQASPGKFEQAGGGTLLLDEISEMPLALQAKLLRVLQEREVERLGGHRNIPLDVRVLATTNRVLREEVGAGRFREDLFYRLNVFPLHLAPLAERPGDILPLTRHLLALRAAPNPAPELDVEAERRLLAHAWPGNVRELDNLVQRALILSDSTVIDAGALHFETAPGVENPTLESAAGESPALDSALKNREGRLIAEALRHARGSRKAAAERLGISPRTLRYKMARLREAGIDVAAPTGPEFA